MHPVQLVIFDCDGVLVDSERITNQVFADMLRDLGLDLTLEEMFDHFVGLSMAQDIEKVTHMLGKAPPEDFAEQFRLNANAALADRVEAVSGIEYALDHLGLPFCTASSGDFSKMCTTLGKTGLLPRFEGRMFSVSQVRAPKPAPDIFLFAAQTMGTAPEHCLVIEDSPTGAKAGIAAGMTVFGYNALTPEHKLLNAGVNRVFDNMSRLPELVRIWNQGLSEHSKLE